MDPTFGEIPPLATECVGVEYLLARMDLAWIGCTEALLFRVGLEARGWPKRILV